MQLTGNGPAIWSIRTVPEGPVVLRTGETAIKKPTRLPIKWSWMDFFVCRLFYYSHSFSFGLAVHCILHTLQQGSVIDSRTKHLGSMPIAHFLEIVTRNARLHVFIFSRSKSCDTNEPGAQPVGVENMLEIRQNALEIEGFQTFRKPVDDHRKWASCYYFINWEKTPLDLLKRRLRAGMGR